MLMNVRGVASQCSCIRDQLAAIKPLTDEYRNFFKNGRALDAHFAALLSIMRPDNMQALHDAHWERLLHDMHKRANALERFTIALDFECEKYWDSMNPEDEDDMSD